MKTKKQTDSKIIEKMESEFSKHFGNCDGVKFFSSPSTLILLGDHTQYSDGTMFSTAVDSFVYLAMRKAEENISIIFENEIVVGDLQNGIDHSTKHTQLNSLIHLINNLVKEGLLAFGFECYLKNETAKVFGLGNHAAMSMGLLRGLSTTACITLNNQQMVGIAFSSERELFGPVVSKPLFYSSLMQKPNTHLYYDTRTDAKKFISVDDKIHIIVCNTNHEKENFHDRCRDRITECEVGVKGLRLYIWGIKNLRDVEQDFLEKHIHMLPKRLYSRCLYNVMERKIVEEALKNLRSKQFDEFAKKLNITHEKLSEIYEISSVTMDNLVKMAVESNVCMGSKMVSCSYCDSTLNYVRKHNVEKFKNYIKKNYKSNNGTRLEFGEYQVSEGAKQLKLSSKITA